MKKWRLFCKLDSGSKEWHSNGDNLFEAFMNLKASNKDFSSHFNLINQTYMGIRVEGEQE